MISKNKISVVRRQHQIQKNSKVTNYRQSLYHMFRLFDWLIDWPAFPLQKVISRCRKSKFFQWFWQWLKWTLHYRQILLSWIDQHQQNSVSLWGRLRTLCAFTRWWLRSTGLTSGADNSALLTRRRNSANTNQSRITHCVCIVISNHFQKSFKVPWFSKWKMFSVKSMSINRSTDGVYGQVSSVWRWFVTWNFF